MSSAPDNIAGADPVNLRKTGAQVLSSEGLVNMVRMCRFLGT